jgi:hypothetical protein
MLVLVEVQIKRKEFDMKWINRATAVMTILLILGAAMGAHAAITYTLTCKAQKSGNITIPLTGFTYSESSPRDPQSGLPTGTRNQPQFKFRFAPSAVYATVRNVLLTNENVTQCILSSGGGASATAATKTRSNSAAPPRPYWEFDNAVFTSVTASGGDYVPGAPLGEVEVTLTAQRVNFMN